MAAYVRYRTDHHGKPTDAVRVRRTMALLLTEAVFLRTFRDFCRAICLEDYPIFRREAARVCEQSKF